MTIVTDTTAKAPFSFCLIAAIVSLAELSTIGVLSLPHGLIIAALQHLMVVLLLATLAYYSYGRSDGGFILLLLVMTAATGPFGASICFLSALVYNSMVTEINTIPCGWIDNFFAYNDMGESEKIHERITFGLDNISQSNIEPFQDILTSGSVLQKQMVIAKISRHFHPKFAPLLLQAVRDPNAAVRVQAATALAKIEHDFTAKYLHIKKTPGNDNNASQLKMAALCDNYAHAGVLDKEGCNELRDRAIKIYETYLAQRGDSEKQLFLARLYLRQEQPAKTCQLLDDAIESGTTTGRAVFWYMEALFRLNDITKLRLVAKRYAHLLGNFDGYETTGETKDVLEAWEPDNGRLYAA
jgi:hypothetical protein